MKSIEWFNDYFLNLDFMRKMLLFLSLMPIISIIGILGNTIVSPLCFKIQ